MKPKCALCTREIGSNEHYWIIRKRTVCKECGVKWKNGSKDHSTGVVISAAGKNHD